MTDELEGWDLWNTPRPEEPEAIVFSGGLSRQRARFEIDYRIGALAWVLRWLHWSKSDLDYQRSIIEWIRFWHRETVANFEDLQGFEAIDYRRQEKAEIEKRLRDAERLEA